MHKNLSNQLNISHIFQLPGMCFLVCTKANISITTALRYLP